MGFCKHFTDVSLLREIRPNFNSTNGEVKQAVILYLGLGPCCAILVMSTDDTLGRDVSERRYFLANWKMIEERSWTVRENRKKEKRKIRTKKSSQLGALSDSATGVAWGLVEMAAHKDAFIRRPLEPDKNIKRKENKRSDFWTFYWTLKRSCFAPWRVIPNAVKRSWIFIVNINICDVIAIGVIPQTVAMLRIRGVLLSRQKEPIHNLWDGKYRLVISAFVPYKS